MTAYDCQFDTIQPKLQEIDHDYGDQFHILADPYLLTLLSDLCSQETFQPRINEMISRIYHSLLQKVVIQEFDFIRKKVPSRMCEFHPQEGIYEGPVLNPDQKVVTVNLARAGTVPSQIVYSELNYLIDPKSVRQDHISISRKTDQNEKVVGSRVSGHKIGGPIQDAILLFPDPMGATGATLVEAFQLYKDFGSPKKAIAIHCIVTPEYIRNIKAHAPGLQVYAARLDRGLSAPETLKTKPGSQLEKEKGLNNKDYIVPGGGGFGEVLNNAFV